MRHIFLLFILLCFPLGGFSKVLLKLDCRLIDQVSQKDFSEKVSAKNCHFFNNKERIEFYDNFVLRVNEHGEILWKYDLLYHHSFKVDEKKDLIYILDASSHRVLNCTTRFDAITILNMTTGKLVKKIDFYNFKKEIYEESQTIALIKAVFQRKAGGFECDTTHVNSFFQIKKDFPSEKMNKKKIFIKGRWFVNLVHSGYVALFESDFSKIVWKSTYSRDFNLTHDIQVVEDKWIGLYVNSYKKKSKDVPRSALVLFDPVDSLDSLKVVILKIDGKTFEQPFTGGFSFISKDKFIYSAQKSFLKNSYAVGKMDLSGVEYLKDVDKLRNLDWFQDPSFVETKDEL
jgi:hypothetical protein